MYIVLKKIDAQEYVIVNANSDYPSDFLKVFGPANYEACEDYISNQ